MAIETILLAVANRDSDRIDELAEAVTDVAGPTGATVLLAHAFEPEGLDRARNNLADSDEDPRDLDVDQVARRHQIVRELGRRFDAADVDYSVRGIVGEDPGDLIVDLGADEGADQIVVGGRRRSPAGKAVFGSTAQTVLLTSPCPVLFVRTD